MHKTLALLVIVVAGLALGGCGGGSSSSEHPVTVPELLPLAVGNEWEYKFTSSVVPAGVLKARPRARGLLQLKQGSGTSDVIRITGTELIGGSEWFVREALYAGEEQSYTLYLRHASQGLMVKESLVDAGYYLLRLPLTVGNSWSVPFDENVTLTITGVGESVISNGVTYDECVLVDDVLQEEGEPQDIIRTWYARHIGVVREERWVGQVLDYTVELLDHTLAD